MNINGFIMQKRSDTYYQGVEGDNWYLNYKFSREIDNFFEENIEKAWCNEDYVDVCNDIRFIQKYINISQEKKINYRVLLCMTTKNIPQMVLTKELDMNFLGYDYADSGGSYYSAVLNDVISKRIPQFANIHLNKYGLFETYESIIDFIKIRGAMGKMECSQERYLEEGDFVIYKIYEIRNFLQIEQ